MNLQLKAVASGLAFQNPLICLTPNYKIDIVRYLNMALPVINFIVPEDPTLVRPALNHPDLSLGNMIWRQALDDIQVTIDWQGAVIHPFCMQAKRAEVFLYRGTTVKILPDGETPFPGDFDAISPELQEEVRLEHHPACRDRVYQNLVHGLQSDRLDARKLPHRRIITDLLQAILRAAADGPGYLHELHLETTEHWDNIVALSGKCRSSCPIAFTVEEVEVIRLEVTATQKYERNVEASCSTLGCLIDGWVPHGKYEKGKVTAEVLRQQRNEDEMGGPFPFIEGSWSPNLT